MDRLLITGASGFVGRRCLHLIAADRFEIFALARNRGEGPANVRWISGDILDVSSVESVLRAVRPTHLLHLAWIATPAVYWESPLNAQWVRASLHLTQRFADQGGRRIVAAGSCAEYDWSRGVCTEDNTPIEPRGFYGVCKNAFREVAAGLAPKIGVSFAWGRIFFAYGRGEPDEKLVTACATALHAGREFRCNTPAAARDFVYVDDVAQMFARLLASDAVGTFNLGSGRATTIGAITNSVGRLMKRQELLHYAPEDAHPAPVALTADMTKTIAATGFTSFLDIDDGIRATLENLAFLA